MQALRDVVLEAAPTAVETIAYDMPAMRHSGRFLVSYGAYRGHYSLFPASHVVRAELADELAPYLHGKATIRFPEEQPIPLDLVGRIVRLRMREVTAGRNGHG
jgi:uncharacterized protein YdhG (YjbR/CyaY superfamily)